MNRNVTATILIVLAIGIYFTITAGILSDAGKVQTVNNEYASAIVTANRMLELQDQVENTYKNLPATDKDRLSKMVPTSVDNIRLIIDLNNVASKHGFTLQNIQAQADQQGGAPGLSNPPTVITAPPGVGGAAGLATISVPTLDTVAVSFEVTAPYLQFVSFMQDLEANLRIMDMTHLSMKSSDNGVYQFSVGLKTYWLRQH